MVDGQDPMFGESSKNLRACLKEAGVDKAVARVFSTLELPEGIMREVSWVTVPPNLRRKGLYIAEVMVRGNLFVGDPTKQGPGILYTWTVQVDLWGAVRGWRTLYESWEGWQDQDEVVDNDPKDPDSFVLQIEESNSPQTVRKQLEQALESILLPWAAATTREMVQVYWTWVKAGRPEDSSYK